MRTVYIDTIRLNTLDKIHEYLKSILDFSDYYGGNLDALFDELTMAAEDTAINLLESDERGGLPADDAKRLKAAIKGASAENGRIALRLWKIN